jgi:hypothetical protein
VVIALTPGSCLEAAAGSPLLGPGAGGGAFSPGDAWWFEGPVQHELRNTSQTEVVEVLVAEWLGAA